jgi:hypothetical protein
MSAFSQWAAWGVWLRVRGPLVVRRLGTALVVLGPTLFAASAFVPWATGRYLIPEGLYLETPPDDQFAIDPTTLVSLPLSQTFAYGVVPLAWHALTTLVGIVLGLLLLLLWLIALL